MNRFLASIALALMCLAAGPLEAANCQTRYRIWQDGKNTFYKYGDTIFLNVGDKVDLYIHAYPSRSEHPYSASGDIAAPTAFGVGGQRPKDVNRVLRLGKHDPSKAKQSFTAVAAGETALGYQITGVVSPGRLDKIARGCRTGQVRITVRGAERRTNTHPPPRPAAAPPVRTANDAAHQLIVQLYTGILRRSPAEARDYPDNFFDQVQRGGLQGLISVAETMTSSTEFRSQSLARTSDALARTGVSKRGLSREVLEAQLLNDMFDSLYGPGAEPYGDARRRMANALNGCISGRQGNDACSRLGRDLLTQPQYQGNNRAMLQYLR